MIRALRIMAMVIALACMADAAFARRVVVTRAQLEAAAVMRLSDALQLLDAWLPQSNDGYTWMPTPRALALPRSTDWLVVLNGQPLDVGVFDATHLELVPVAMAEIDSIAFDDGVDVSSIGRSWEATGARIEIFAARASHGWTVATTASVGNEIGDPGPYRYTDLATPNVDAIGADASLWFARGARNWYASLSGAMMQSPFTDPAMRESTSDALTTLRPGATVPETTGWTSWFYDPTWPAVLRLSSTARVGVRAGGGWHEGVLALSNARRYFHYSEPFASEVPTDQRAIVGSVDGSFIAGATTIGYRAFATEKVLDDQDDVLAFDYDWEAQHTAGDVDITHVRGATRAVVFAGAEKRSVETADTLSDDSDTFVRAGAQLERAFGAATHADVEFATTSDGDDSAISAAARLSWVVRLADTLRVRVAVRERLFSESDDLWLWSERGYNLLERNGASYSIDGPIGTTRVVSADAGWSSSGIFGGIELNLGVRRFDNAYMETNTFTYDPVTCAFDATTLVVTDQTGHAGTLDLRLYHSLGGQSGGIFSWNYIEEFNSDPVFGDLWQTIPRHRLRYTVWARPRSTWALWARVCHDSPTWWSDYASIDGVMCDADGIPVTYHARVDGFTYVDAMVQHGMWRERLWIDVAARNVFDADVRYQPLGASFDLTLFVQARLRWSD